MMQTPAALLEQALAAHGDTLYRMALLLGGDERAADALLEALAAERVAAWREAPPPDAAEPELLRALAGAARAAEAQPARAGQKARRPISFGPFATGRLPLDQRLALGLHLILGYDGPRSAEVTGGSAEQARAQLVAAVRALGPAAGHSLTDRVSGELCPAVRETLVDPSAGSRHGAAVRGHLAACGLCRSFDHDWAEIVHAVEDAVRAELRQRTLPPALAARILAAARPRRRALSPSLRLVLAPLAVLALIAALVLPGFLSTPVSVVQREAGETTDPQALIGMALKRHAAPPDRGGVWYGRYRTQWYFDEGVYAPLTAEVWLDPGNPARHRLQLTHADGGAPYELQLGNGRDRLYYALDTSYAPALYGSLPTPTRPEEPALLAERLDRDGLLRARDERLAAGPWSLAPGYLRQAQAAGDLRVLGRQRDRGQTVEILTFSGFSPLGLPPDAPGATAQRVTVLLAIDVEDGLLRSATELSGPAGAEQVSRVTWRLEDEQWLVPGQQADEAFNIGRAWTGMGDFSERGRHRSADLAVPLIPASAAADPARLLRLDLVVESFWMPAAPPAGVDRALLIWPNVDANRGGAPQGLVYLGPGRRLLIAFNRARQFEGEPVREGIWDGTLRPGPTGRYTLALRRPAANGGPASGAVDPSSHLTVDAFGFSRDELIAVVRSMRPFDLDALAAQDGLFVGRDGDPQARALLLQVAQESANVPEGRARFVRALSYARQAPPRADQRQDPYHGAEYDGQPERVRVEQWAARDGGPVLYTESGAADGGKIFTRSYIGPAEAWHYRAGPDVAYGYSTRYTPPHFALPRPAQAAVEMLTFVGDGPALAERPGGGALISRSEPAGTSFRYGYLLNNVRGGSPYLFDLRPISITTELALGRAGDPDEVAVYAVGASGARTLVERYEIRERGEVPLAEAPAAVRDGAMPAAAYTADYRGLDSWSPAPLVTRTLTEALALHAGEVYVLDGAALQYVEGGPLDGGQPTSGDFLEPAIGQRLALRLTYAAPPLEPGAPGVEIKLTQGPAAPLRALLRSMPDVPWEASEPARLSVAGREVDGWLGAGGREHVIFELGDTLVVVEAPPGWYRGGGAAILSGLRLARRG